MKKARPVTGLIGKEWAVFVRPLKGSPPPICLFVEGPEPPRHRLITCPNFTDRFLIRLLPLVKQSSGPGAIPNVGAAEVCADRAGIREQTVHDIRIPLAIHRGIRPVAIGSTLIHNRFPFQSSVRHQNGFSRDFMPMEHVLDGLFEGLETEDIHIRIGRLHNLEGERRMRFIPVSENQMMGIIAANGIVGDLVIALRQLKEPGLASL